MGLDMSLFGMESSRNPNQWKAARKIANSVPRNCSWRAAFYRVFALAAGENPPPESNGSETLPERLPTQEQDQKQDQEQKQEQEQSPRGRRAFDPGSVPGLDLEAWGIWVAYRAERKPAIKPVSMQAAAEELAEFGPDQMAVVKKSKAAGYQGLFSPKGANGAPGVKPFHRKTADELEAEELARDAQH